ncbi:MAG: hypothetical protein V4819_16545 [Verrucomicrobiota bacterium]
MIPPDWKTCDEGELWRFVAWHLEGAGIPTVLVGGAVVAIYSEGLYHSGDLDRVLDRHRRSHVTEALKELGFVPDKSRYFKHPECKHLYVEFPPGPVELGEEYPVSPAEISVEGRILRLLSPTDCVKDRLAAYIHWKLRDSFRQAVLVAKRQKDRIDFKNLAAWCDREGGADSYAELLGELSKTETP